MEQPQALLRKRRRRSRQRRNPSRLPLIDMIRGRGVERRIVNVNSRQKGTCVRLQFEFDEVGSCGRAVVTPATAQSFGSAGALLLRDLEPTPPLRGPRDLISTNLRRLVALPFIESPNAK